VRELKLAFGLCLAQNDLVNLGEPIPAQSGGEIFRIRVRRSEQCCDQEVAVGPMLACGVEGIAKLFSADDDRRWNLPDLDRAG
jgi:hypothetical protein